MLEFIHTTDWHLGFLHGKHPNPVAVLLKEIKKVFDYAVQHSVPHIIVSGDLTHTDVMPPDVLRGVMRLLVGYDNFLNIHIIPGNHCFNSKNIYSLLALKEVEPLMQSVSIYTTLEQVEIDGVIVNFLPYPHATPLPSERPALNVSHLTPAGSMMDNGYPAKKGEVLELNGDYWINGHLHMEQTGANYHCCGTLYPVRFNEKGKKGFTHFWVSENPDGYIEAKRKRIYVEPSIRFEEIVITNESQFQTLENNPDVFYSLKVEPGIQVPHALLRGYKNILKLTAGKNVVSAPDRDGKAESAESSFDDEIDDRVLLAELLATINLSEEAQKRAMDLDNVIWSEVHAAIASQQAVASRKEVVDTD